MEIGGQIQVEVSINGTPFPIMSIPGLQCQIITSKRSHLPELKLHLPDPSSIIDTQLPINDGTQISVLLTDTTQSNAQPVIFRSFGTPKRSPITQTPNITMYTITGKMDSLPFVSSTPNAAFTGTSLSVMQQIASKNNFTFSSNATSTKDSMTWLPGRKTWSEFADHVTQHAYADENSAFAWIVDETKKLHYVNIPKLYNASAYKAYIYYGAPDGSTDVATMIPCLDQKAYNRSGVLNSIGAYGMRTTQPALTGNTPGKYLTSDSTVFGNKLDIATDIAKAVSKVSRMHLVPHDTGNTHDNYMQAKHQNRRISCTYCQNVYVMLYNQSNLSVFDTVKFTSNTGGNQSNLVSGNYTVTAISRVMYSNRYYEKLELTNNGPNDPNAALE